jgi:SAM-dependent methyltransferase
MSERIQESSPAILATVERYYAERLQQFGPTPRGVDWTSAESQELRFDRLLEILQFDRLGTPKSLADVGCGYGALLDHLHARGLEVDYTGFDISRDMIEAARALHPADRSCFTTRPDLVRPVSYAVASGIFNVKLHHSTEEWWNYTVDGLNLLDRLSLRGFAFNMLSTYSDPERRRDDLFYADPLQVFDFCKRRYSSRVALLHDYPLFEFTLLVRK